MLAGCNGAGKSSIGGAALRQSGIEFFNPDEAARRIEGVNVARHPRPTQRQVNAAAWNEGRRLMQRAIDERADFALIRLLPHLTELYLYDNSADADPDRGAIPAPRLLLHCRERRIGVPRDLGTLLGATPDWARPVVAAAIKLHLAHR